jgi:hypothetical protein
VKVADLTSDRDGTSANNTTITVSWPAGVAAGDVVDIGFLTNTTSSTVSSLLAGANDWNALGAIQHGGLVIQSANTGLLHVVRKLDAVDVAAGGVTLTLSTGGRLAGGGSAYRGVGTFRVSTPTQAAAATVAAATMAQTATRSDFGLIAVARVASGTIAVLTGGTGFPTDVNHSTNFATTGVNMTLATAHSGSPPGSGQNVGGQTVSATAGTVAQVIVALTEFDAVPVGPLPWQGGKAWRLRNRRVQTLIQPVPWAGLQTTQADGSGSAQADSSGAATSTVAAAAAGAARADASGAATVTSGTSGAATAVSAGSASSTSTVPGAGLASATAGAGGATSGSTASSGAGSARGDASGAAAGAVTASAAVLSQSQATGTSTSSAVSTGAASARSDAAGAATQTTAGSASGAAFAISAAAGAATITTAGLGAAQARAESSALASPITSPATGTATTTGSASAVVHALTSAAGDARTFSTAYAELMAIVQGTALASALSNAAGAASTAPVRTLSLLVAMGAERFHLEQPAGRDRWALALGPDRFDVTEGD